jgi:hypothetical protein
VSDIVINGELPDNLKNAAAMYTGCVSGALKKDEYLNIISDNGFIEISIPKVKKILIPDEIYLGFINNDELTKLKESGVEILSVTVGAKKSSDTQCC